MIEVQYEHGMWVSPGFGKYKGREWPASWDIHEDVLNIDRPP